MISKKMLQMIAPPALLAIVIAGAPAATKEKETAHELFALKMAKLHTSSVNTVCTKLVSKAFNIDAYKVDYETCAKTIEAEFTESKKPN